MQTSIRISLLNADLHQDLYQRSLLTNLLTSRDNLLTRRSPPGKSADLSQIKSADLSQIKSAKRRSASGSLVDLPCMFAKSFWNSCMFLEISCMFLEKICRPLQIPVCSWKFPVCSWKRSADACRFLYVPGRIRRDAVDTPFFTNDTLFPLSTIGSGNLFYSMIHLPYTPLQSFLICIWFHFDVGKFNGSETERAN